MSEQTCPSGSCKTSDDWGKNGCPGGLGEGIGDLTKREGGKGGDICGGARKLSRDICDDDDDDEDD